LSRRPSANAQRQHPVQAFELVGAWSERLGFNAAFIQAKLAQQFRHGRLFAWTNPISNHQGADVPQAVAIRRKPEAALAHQALPRAPRRICEAKKQTDHRKGREPFELGVMGHNRSECKGARVAKTINANAPSRDLQQFGSKGLLNQLRRPIGYIACFWGCSKSSSFRQATFYCDAQLLI
jgi:hypothetical protein